MLKQLIAGAALLALQAGTANAYTTSAPYMTGSYNMTVTEGLTGGIGFNAMPLMHPSPFTGDTATASFTYTGALNFDNTAPQNGPGTMGDLNSAFGFSASNISNYRGAGTVEYGDKHVANFGGSQSLTNFLASSGSASGYAYGSLYTIDLGVLAKGTILDVTHDDGISIFQKGVQVGPTVSGPTSVVTDQVVLTDSGDTFLYYSRQNGTPSILQVDVPEPMSIALLGVGLAGIGMIRRRQRG